VKRKNVTGERQEGVTNEGVLVQHAGSSAKKRPDSETSGAWGVGGRKISSGCSPKHRTEMPESETEREGDKFGDFQREGHKRLNCRSGPAGTDGMRKALRLTWASFSQHGMDVRAKRDALIGRDGIDLQLWDEDEGDGKGEN